MKKGIIEKVIDNSIYKCYQTLQYGWYQGVKYLKDTNNSRKMYTKDTEGTYADFMSKDGRLESIEIENMDNIDWEDYDIECYGNWIYPNYDIFTSFQRYGEDELGYVLQGSSYEGGARGYIEEWNEDDYEEVLDDIENNVLQISGMFDKVKGLSNNLRIYRGGKFDASLNVGDISEFDTFTSCSFKENIGKGYADKEGRYMMTILAPEGTKALIGTHKFDNGYYHDLEHELTLNKGQKYEVVSKDDTTIPPSVTIKLIN